MGVIDIVEIKKQAKEGLIRFYVDRDIIYCKNNTGEVVKVGEVEHPKPKQISPSFPKPIGISITTSDRDIPPEVE